MTDAAPGRRVALVTGASSGIGRATVRALAEQGWSVVLVARSAADLNAVLVECADAPAEFAVAAADVADGAAIDEVMATAVARFGRVDAVIHAAAAVGYGRFEDVPAEVFDRVIATNLTGTANVARTALRQFRTQGGGHLVLIGSLLGKIAVPLMSPYVTSKWAVHGLARMIQLEARETPGVQVGLIWPGSINTPAYLTAANYVGREGRPPPPIDPPEKVAAEILAELRSNRRERSVGIANHVVVLGFRLMPAVFDLLVTPLVKIGALSKRSIPATSGSAMAPSEPGTTHGVWGRWGGRDETLRAGEER